jgi:imidazolonepropionase-like amidohydrolase
MDGDMETMQNRNLPFNAGTAIGYGLSEADALRAVTINAAKILGINDRTGSIEVGKEANFLLTKGDLFDIRTSKIEAIYFKGIQLDISTRQEALGQKYREKLEKGGNHGENH